MATPSLMKATGTSSQLTQLSGGQSKKLTGGTDWGSIFIGRETMIVSRIVPVLQMLFLQSKAHFFISSLTLSHKAFDLELSQSRGQTPQIPFLAWEGAASAKRLA